MRHANPYVLALALAAWIAAPASAAPRDARAAAKERRDPPPAPAANHPPDCTHARAETPILWPPNHQMVPVTIVGVTDPDGDAVTLRVTAVTQDEPATGDGTGPHCPDAVVATDGSAFVRAERVSTGTAANGRVYRLHFTADDGHGGVSEGTADVGCPLNRSVQIMVDSGQSVDALAACLDPSDPDVEVAIRSVRRAGDTALVTFALPAEADVFLGVFDIAGRRIATLATGTLDAGVRTATWRLAGLRRGVYFVRLTALDAASARSIIIR